VQRLAILVLLGACDSDEVMDITDIPQPVGACDGMLTNLSGRTGEHVPVGTRIEWTSNPPATGPHYPSWAGWNRHYQQLDRGYYVHNAEHGGIVLLYNCPAGCQDVVDSLLDVVRNATPDPTCTDLVRSRMIVAADPLLPPDVQVAAVAWDRVYTASCFDPFVAAFARQQYGNGPEDFCADGNPMTGVLIRP